MSLAAAAITAFEVAPVPDALRRGAINLLVLLMLLTFGF